MGIALCVVGGLLVVLIVGIEVYAWRERRQRRRGYRQHPGIWS